MSTMKQSLAVVATLSLSAVSMGAMGCAALFPSIEKDPDFGQYFTMRASGNAEQAKLSEDRLYGPDIELSKKPDGFRGRSQVGIIDLRIEENRIVGSSGPGRTELYVEENNRTLLIKGNYAGKLGEIELRPESLKGMMGSCQFDLSKAQDSVWYTGGRSCDGGRSAVQLALPAALESRSAVERALMLAVFLGR
jgi:hypothetical protein